MKIKYVLYAEFDTVRGIDYFVAEEITTATRKMHYNMRVDYGT